MKNKYSEYEAKLLLTWAGYTPGAFCKKYGYSPSAFSQFIRGKNESAPFWADVQNALKNPLVGSAKATNGFLKIKEAMGLLTCASVEDQPSAVSV